MSVSTPEIKLIIAEAKIVDDALNEAVSRIRALALGQNSQGILVTRHTCNEFSVSLSSDVPFGETLENTRWQ